MTTVPTIRLPADLDATLKSRHPWIYRNRLPDDAPALRGLVDGDWIRVETERQSAFGLYDSEGAIAVRLFERDEVPDDAWWTTAVERAVRRRDDLRDAGHTAYRLIHGEGDGLPAIVADRYGRFAVLQPHAASVEPYLELIARSLLRAAGLKGVVVRRDDGLDTLAGEPPPPEETIVENGLKFLANVRDGQKTGLFLDHREHRATVRELAAGRRVANLFAYVGGFSVHALAGGATEVWSVDVAAAALRDAERNVALNELPPELHHAIEADVFAAVPEWASAGERFDLTVLDPPSLARSKRQRATALRAYQRLNADAARLTAPGGLLATASCTAQVDRKAFEAAVRSGLRAAGRRGRVIVRGSQPSDHPVLRSFPEGRYLKFLVLELDG